MRRSYLGKNNPNWRGGKPKKICLNCGKEFFANRNIKGIYCSLSCTYNRKENRTAGVNHHSWKGDKVGYQSIHRWIKRKLGNPKICWSCGEDNPNKHYEWSNISGKYKRDFRDWQQFCRQCHMIFDTNRMCRGDNHSSRKLNNKSIIEIRAAYKKGNISQKELARQYNISQQHISRIIKEKAWSHI